MANEQFESRIKRNFDIVIFSQLLGTDHEENRLNSYLTLYAHISNASQAIDEMKGALCNNDICQLRSLCDDLRHTSKALGMYRISESCEDILIKSTKMDQKNTLRDNEGDAGGLHIDVALAGLEANLASVRATVDTFYAEIWLNSQWDLGD
ncbi:hypothetical protein N7450_011384 [Penicillium hetheringtonii]|uniref:HPt domain-containing protein n=1 Tax=Penicillium hetheringtonii TaxID=911720 RepID=A0AAD6DA65_9EURO|nr:hypothetical protein N7450_011384 [Penicillium hetheringtonii]